MKRYLTLCGSVTTAHKTQNSHLLKLSINTILNDTNLHSGFMDKLPVYQVTAYTAHHKSNEIKPVSNHFEIYQFHFHFPIFLKGVHGLNFNITSLRITLQVHKIQRNNK